MSSFFYFFFIFLVCFKNVLQNEIQEKCDVAWKSVKTCSLIFCCSNSMQTVHYHVIMQLDSNGMLATV